MHLKDLREGTFRPLGEGGIDFADVLAALGEVGYDGWLVVELGSYPGDPVEAARISKTFLDKVLPEVTA